MVSAKLLWKPTDKLEFVLAGEYIRHYDTSVRPPSAVQPATPFAPSAAITAQMTAYGVVASETNTNSADHHLGSITMVNKGGSLHASYELGDHTLTSITAYRETSYINDTPADLVPNTVASYFPYNIGKLYSNKFSEDPPRLTYWALLRISGRRLLQQAQCHPIAGAVGDCRRKPAFALRSVGTRPVSTAFTFISSSSNSFIKKDGRSVDRHRDEEIGENTKGRE